MNAIHRGAWTDHGIQAEDTLVRVLVAKAVDHVDFGADGPRRAGRRAFDRLANEFGRAVAVGRIDDFAHALRVDHDVHVWIVAPGVFDLSDRETGVDGAVALPEDHLGFLQLLFGEAAQRFERVPDKHIFGWDALRETSVTSEMLVGEEKNPLAAFERPIIGPRRRSMMCKPSRRSDRRVI